MISLLWCGQPWWRMRVPREGRPPHDFLLILLRRFGDFASRQRGIGQSGSSPEGEPSRQVIAQRRPGSLHRCFQAAAAAELAQAASFFNPGGGKLGEVRPLSVNPLRFFRGHLRLEGHGRRGFLGARNRPEPGGAGSRWGARAA